MKVFVSWSGDTSHATADALRRLLPCMIQGLDIFLSRHDLESGGRWATQLSNELEQSSFGIICLTADNHTAPWIVYEAGALTKLSEGRACGLLLDGLTPANVAGPLAQFQHRRMAEDDFFLLLRDLNHKQTSPLKDDQLRLVFSKWWPDLNAEYQASVNSKPTNAPKAATRKDRDLLEEILERIRSLPNGGDSSDIRVQQAILTLTRVVLARPKNEIEVLILVNELKDRGQHNEVETLGAAQDSAVERLIEAGLLSRSKGRLALSRFLGDEVLQRLSKSDFIRSGERPSSDNESEGDA